MPIRTGVDTLQQTSRPTPVRLALALLCCAALGCGASSAAGRAMPPCLILDAPPPLYRASLGLLPDSELDDQGDTSFLELDADRALGFLKLDDSALDMRLRMHLAVVLDSTDAELPNQLLSLAADTGWTVRHPSGSALQFRAAPGFYTDLEGFESGAFNMPVSLALVHRVSPDLSGILGARMRPGFNTPILPLIGVTWTPADRVRVEAHLPRSRAAWYVNQKWSTAFGLAWRPRGYHLNDDNLGRDTVNVEDWRAMLEVTRHLHIDFSLTTRIGYAFHRRVVFDRGAGSIPEEIDLDGNWFVAVGCAGPF